MCELVLVAFVAAAINGSVVDNQTGRPVARTTVVVQPVAGTNGTTHSVRTDLNGAFEFSDLAAGTWLIIATRRGFAPTRMRVESGAEAAIRLRRFGAISGTVVDENDVGLQDQEVLAYKDTHPPVVVARAKTDDRGVYRLEYLDPGAYFVRTATRQDDEGSYLPTVSRETVRVDYDREVTNVDIRPIAGRLMTFAGRAFGPSPITVFLISDMGVQQTAADSSGNFRFPPIAPGQYELYAQSRELAAWQSIQIYDDGNSHRVTLAPFPELRLAVENAAGRPIDPASAPILVRRRDLASEGKTDTFRGQGRVLAPGRYEFALAPSPSWYLAAVNGHPPRADGFAEIVVNGTEPVEVKVQLSDRPATLRGVVRSSAHDPVAGVAVHLTGLRTIITDVHGEFEFYGLAPGTYGVGVEDGAPRTVELKEGQDQTIDLDLKAPE